MQLGKVDKKTGKSSEETGKKQKIDYKDEEELRKKKKCQTLKRKEE